MKKLRKNKGFTLVETLAAMLIVVMISAVMVAGINSAITVYKKSTFLSESETLVSTLNTRLSDILRYAQYDSTDASAVVHFTNYSENIGKGTLTLYNDKIMIVPDNKGAGPSEYRGITSDISYTTMKISDFTLTYKDGVYSGSYKVTSSAVNTTPRTVKFSYMSLYK